MVFSRAFVSTFCCRLVVASSLVLASSLLGIGMFVAPAQSQVPLPGTQPGEFGDGLFGADDCSNCHGGFNPGSEVTFAWSGSMMSQAGRDPLFYAALAVANQDVPDSGEFCLRCHVPQGWLSGRSTPTDGSALTADDLHGVQCHSCHRMVDPLSPEGQALVEPDVPGYGNAMMVIDTNDVRRGPYDDVTTAPHGTAYSPFFEQGQMCGTCHDVSNPFFATDANTQPPHAYGAIERTFSEWELSSFSAMGDAGSCQGCHMPVVEGRVCSFGPNRNPAHLHDFMGANTWIPDVIPMFFPEVNTIALAAGKSRAEESLRRAAELGVETSFDGGELVASVQVTNLTGHKLPTGYPEGRRVWVQVTGYDTRGNPIFESGAYDGSTGVLTLDSQVQVFEMKMGLSPTQAATHGLTPGESFHFILNDIIVKDNRIPPMGFNNAAFAGRGMAPVGATYADLQHWADLEYRMPDNVARLKVSLLYQTSSKEYIEFLRDENATNAWGTDLHAAWEATGRSAPVTMDEIELDLAFQSRAGNVNAGVGALSDVLLINGSSGDENRCLEVGVRQPIEVTMGTAPAGPSNACFALYVWNGVPTDVTNTVQRRGVGNMVFPTPWRGGSPQPRFIWNNLGFPASFGVPDFASAKAPTTVISSSGVATPNRAFTFQGFINDLGSIQGDLAITNAVIVKTTP